MVNLAILIAAEDQSPGRLFEIEKVLGHGIDLVGPEFHDFEPTSFSPNLKHQIIFDIVFSDVFVQFCGRKLDGIRFFEIEVPWEPALVVFNFCGQAPSLQQLYDVVVPAAKGIVHGRPALHSS